MALNQAGCQVTGQAAVPGKCTPLQHCEEVAGRLLAGLPPGHRVGAARLGAVGASTACRLVQDGSGAEVALVGLTAGS